MSEPKKSSRGKGRTRNFATVVYPESAPADWRERLSDAHVMVLISPLHDKDLNPDGSPKKAHYHVLVIYDSVKDFDTQVKPLFDSIGGVGREAVNSCRGYARYLCHLDNPEKHQYSMDEVTVMGGADYRAITSLPTDDIRTLKEIFAYIREHDIYSFAEFVDICAANNDEWFTTVTMSRAIIVEKYLKSVTWERQNAPIAHKSARDKGKAPAASAAPAALTGNELHELKLTASSCGLPEDFEAMAKELGLSKDWCDRDLLNAVRAFYIKAHEFAEGVNDDGQQTD